MKKPSLRLLSLWGLLLCVQLPAINILAATNEPTALVSAQEGGEQASPKKIEEQPTQVAVQAPPPVPAEHPFMTLPPTQPILNELYHYLSFWGKWALASATMFLVNQLAVNDNASSATELPIKLITNRLCLYAIFVNYFGYLTPLLSQYTREWKVFHKGADEAQIENNGAYHITTLLLHGLCQAVASWGVLSMIFKKEATDDDARKKLSMFCVVTACMFTLLPVLAALINTIIKKRQLPIHPRNTVAQEPKGTEGLPSAALSSKAIANPQLMNLVTTLGLSLVLTSVSIAFCIACFEGVGLKRGWPTAGGMLPMSFVCTLVSQGISLLAGQAKQLTCFQIQPASHTTLLPEAPENRVGWLVKRQLDSFVVGGLVFMLCWALGLEITKKVHSFNFAAYIIQPILFALPSSSREHTNPQVGKSCRNNNELLPQPSQPSA